MHIYSVNRNSVFEIEKWTTPDKGLSWFVKAITCNSKNDNVRSSAIRNATEKDKLQVILMNVERYVHYTDYHTLLKINKKEGAFFDF